MRGRMYTDMQTGWLKTMIGKLEDGMYWHIPRSNSLLRIDKKRQQFILISGDKTSTELRSLERELKEFGYLLVNKETARGYFTV